MACKVYEVETVCLKSWHEFYLIQYFVRSGKFELFKSVLSSGTPESGSMTAALTPVLSNVWKRGRRCLFHSSIVGNFMVCQDQIETNVL